MVAGLGLVPPGCIVEVMYPRYSEVQNEQRILTIVLKGLSTGSKAATGKAGIFACKSSDHAHVHSH